MGEQKNRWNWEVPGFQPRKSFELLEDDVDMHNGSLLRRYSVSTASVLPAAHSSQLLVACNKQNLASKVDKIKDKVKRAKEDYLELRQEASVLQEYSNAKLDRVTRYLGVLADKTRKLDQAALETEARISPLIIEKKRLYNDLVDSKRWFQETLGCVVAQDHYLRMRIHLLLNFLMILKFALTLVILLSPTQRGILNLIGFMDPMLVKADAFCM